MTPAGSIWSRHRDKVLYLVVGAGNTLFAYLVFALFWWLLGERLHPSVVLILVYTVTSVYGFLMFRRFVFGPAEGALREFVRYQAVYLPLLVVNLVLLPAALKYSDWNAYAIQAAFAVVAVVAGYLGSKYFAFRKGGRAAE